MKNKEITSLNNPELKFLISLRKNKIRRNENKSIAEGYRENVQLINSNYDIDTLYVCSELFVGNNNFELIDQFKIKVTGVGKSIAFLFGFYTNGGRRPFPLLLISP